MLQTFHNSFILMHPWCQELGRLECYGDGDDGVGAGRQLRPGLGGSWELEASAIRLYFDGDGDDGVGVREASFVSTECLF